jgi:hypothetical protein
MRRRLVVCVTRESLESMSTRALLGRLQRLRECEDSPDSSDLSPTEISALAGILFKSDPEWSAAYDQVREVLATREHVQSAASRREERPPPRGERRVGHRRKAP